MGKEWMYWVGGGGRRQRASEEMKEAAARSPGCMCAVFQLFDLHHFQLPLNQQDHQFDLDDRNFIPEEEEDANPSKGVEAPRNSLEFEDPAAMNVISNISTAMKEREKEKDESLIFPVGIQIRTSHDKTSSSPRVSTTKSRTGHEFSSQCDNTDSPGTKTPSLVARLMGLDLLPPDQCSPSSSSSSSNIKSRSNFSFNQRTDVNILYTRSNRAFYDDDISVGARSLPETPRISSSSRRSDVVEHHRLSLQINKENIHEELGSRSAKSRKGKFWNYQTLDENRSPGHYARQIVKQVKESVSRRVGLTDITNHSTKNKSNFSRRDENLIPLKSCSNKKASKVSSSGNNDQITSPNGKQSITQSCSPRLKFLETNHKRKPTNTNSDSKSPRISTSCPEAQGIANPSMSSKSSMTRILLQENEKKEKKKDQSMGKCNSNTSSHSLKHVPPQAVRNKKEEAFVRRPLMEKKSKKTPLSNELLNISGPALLPVKKDPSPPATKLLQKQSEVSNNLLSSKKSTQLSCNPSHSYKQLHLHPQKIFAVSPDNVNGCATTFAARAAAEHRNYIQRILKRAGITGRILKWHTPSHPLDPSIFHYLELFQPTTASAGTTVLSRRCNRKLIFQLVDELLSEILRPHFSFYPWVSLVASEPPPPSPDELCEKIQSFPAKNCQVLEDIDALIDADFGKSNLSWCFEEERERIVCEIEGEIMERLVREAVAMVMVGVRTVEDQRQRLTDVTWKCLS